MGYMQAEQVTQIIEATKDKPNYYWLLVIAIAPVILTTAVKSFKWIRKNYTK
jgi:hypothetical protein